MAKGNGNWSPEFAVRLMELDRKIRETESYIFKLRCKRPRSEMEIARLEEELYILRRKKYELIKK